MGRQKVLFIGDLYNWAMHHIYIYLESELKRFYCIEYITKKRFNLLKWYYIKRYDILYFMYALLLEDIDTKLFKNRVITGVHCHWEFCDKSSPESALASSHIMPDWYLQILEKATRVGAISKILYNVCHKYAGEACYYTPQVIDPSVLFPERSFESKDPQIRIGWAQSEDNHGFKRRIKEIREVIRDFKRFKLVEIGNSESKIKGIENMRRWYNNIDIYVCFSLLEGGPLPVFEAMACGVPVISTPVGEVPEVVINNENGFIVENTDDLRDVLKRIESSPQILKEMGMKARHSIEEHKSPAALSVFWRKFIEG